MSNAQRAHADDAEPGKRPVARFKHGGVEVAVWANTGENGTMFNTTISNTYKEESSDEWKETKSFSPTDLLVASELSCQAFQEITKLKQQGRGR